MLLNSEHIDFSLWHLDCKEVKVREKGEGKKERGVQERQYLNKCKKKKWKKGKCSVIFSSQFCHDTVFDIFLEIL